MTLDFNKAFEEAERTIEGEPEQGSETSTEPFEAEMMDLAALEGLQPPPREWLWNGWMPHARAVYFTGPGAAGKSLLMQQLGTAVVLGIELFGYATRQGPVIGLWGEDDSDEVWRRQDAINRRFGCTMTELVAAGLCWIPTSRDITMLRAEGMESGFKVLEEFQRLRDMVDRLRPVGVIIDGLTLVYEGGDGSRALITRVMRAFDEIARTYGCTIILIGHNNKTGEFSGSTAFENAVRARISLAKAETSDGEEVTRLALPKANYHGKAQIDMQFRDGCFVAVSEEHMSSADRLERDMRRSQAEARFLEGVDKLTTMQRTLSPSNKASNYAPKLIRQRHTWRFTEKELDAAMWRLLEKGELVESTKLPFKMPNSRRYAKGLARPGHEPSYEEGAPAEDASTGEGACTPAELVRPVPSEAEASEDEAA